VDLPLDSRTRFGFVATCASTAAARQTAALAETLGYDSVWTGDHIAFPLPMLDPLLQLTALAAASERLLLGTSVYLLPLRHPTPVAKQVATLDHLSGGRFVFGVGIGGEFPREFEACGVPVRERGARFAEAIPLLRRLWSGEQVESTGRFYPFPPVRLLPRPVQPGGPPIWCGGRRPAALERIGRLADGWIGYALDPERFAAGLGAIARAAADAGRRPERFGSGHLLFVRIERDHERALDVAAEHLSRRYAMDFRSAAGRYAALGKPSEVAARIEQYRRAGVRHFVLDPVGPAEDHAAQIEQFAREVLPCVTV
jgi:probable F420-dependent oxidoreductase